MLSRRKWFAMSFALVAVAYGVPAHSQSTEARLSGVVRDPSGAGVPGANLAITNQATGASQAVTSSADGSYAASLAPGTYSVTVTLKGFGRQTQKDLKLDAGATLTADFTLQARLEEEITVTSMKREETIHNTPFSVAAPTGDDLRDRGADSIEGVAANVGGFTVQSLGPGQSQVAMRGISAGQIVRDQPGVKEQVGVYLDESVVSLSLFTPDLDLFDLSRVEVLRGPQGTLFGSGSLSGTVRYITNQPELGATKYFGEFGLYTIQDGNQGGSAKAGFNAPLGDKAAARVAGYYSRLGGWIDTPVAVRSGDVVRPDPDNFDADVNTGYRTGVRAAVTIAPNDRFSVTPRFVYQKVKMDGWNRVDIFNILANQFTTTRPAVTLGDRKEYVQLDETFTDEFALGDVTFNYNFGSVALTSITSYIDRDVLVIRDATSLTGSVTGGTIGLGENIYTLDSPLKDATRAKIFTEELRLSGSRDKLKWVVGGFFSKIKRDYGQDLPTIGFEDLSGIPTAGNFGAPKDSLFWSDLHYDLKQFAAFGEGTLSLNDEVSVTAGLRYYHFDEEKQQTFDGLFADFGGSNIGTTKANGVAPRFILSYKLSDDTTLNAQVSRGFRLGGINDPLNIPLCTDQDLLIFGGITTRPPPGSGLPPGTVWKDETAWNYEVGSKSRIFANRGSLNIAAFYTDVRDLQATLTAGSCSSRVIFNVPKARSQGVEAEFAVAPNKNFDFAISGSYNDSEMRSSIAPADVTGIREGRRLPTVPKFQFAAAATYQWEVRPGSMAYVTGTFQHVGSRFTQASDEDLGVLNLLSFGANTIGAPLTASTFLYDPELPAYDIVNLRLGIRREKWDVSLYVNNLSDEEAFLALDRERGTRARIFYLTNQPRTFGVTARVNF